MRVKTLISVGLLLLAVGALAKESGEPDTRLHLDLTLDDGSRIGGRADDTKLELLSAFGKVEIPLSKIRRVEPNDDKETVTVATRNGDRVRGALTGTLPLQTYGGERRELACASIRALRVTPPITIAGSEAVNWQLEFRNVKGWDVTNRNGSLTVESIDPEAINRASGGDWSTVVLMTTVPEKDDFAFESEIAWDSGDAGRLAMQSLYFTLKDLEGNEIASVGHYDAWSGATGRRYSRLAMVEKKIRPGTQPATGNARIEVTREDGKVAVTWDGETIQEGESCARLGRIVVYLQFYAYRGTGIESVFGTVTLNRLSVR